MITRASLQTDWKIHAAGAAVCVALVSAAWCFGLAPMLETARRVGELESRATELQAEAVDLDRTRRLLRDRLEVLGREIESAHVRLEAVDRINDRLADLTRLADEAGVALKSVTPSPPQRSPRFDFVGIRLAGEGGYRAGVALLDRIHAELPDVHVTGFDLTAVDVDVSPTARIEIGLRWYARSDAEVAAVETK